MDENAKNRTKTIGIRLTPDEYLTLKKKWQETTCRKLSDYVRHHLFEKPVTKLFRNKSIDDTMSAFSELRRELNQAGSNFNQVVKKLNSLNQIQEFRHWLMTYEVEKQTLINQVESIKKHIQKIAQTWLQ